MKLKEKEKDKDHINQSKTDRLKTVIKNNPKMFMMVGIIFLLAVSSVAAYWIFAVDQDVVYEIRGGGAGELEIALPLSDRLVLVNESLNDLQYLEIYNPNGAVLMEFNASEIVESINPLCDAENDILIEYFDQSNNTLKSGDKFWMNSSTNIFMVNTTAVNQRVCDSNINVTISITETVI